VSNELDIKSANEETLRKMQVIFMKSLIAGMNVDEPSASMLAIVERFLARMNMGMIDLPDEEDMTEEERKIIADFEEVEGKMDSSIFTVIK
jgi:hypothetical protein